ncbi:MAG: LCP family protein [Synergistes sp.]|nr:LCP family protein [Synergistes sp.]
MKTKTRTIILAVVLGVVAMFGGVAFCLYSTWHASTTDLRSAFEDESKKKEDVKYSELLKQQGRINILLLGEDDVEGSRRSDTILFITVDIDDKNMRVMSLPRDTRVSIPGHGVQKLNHAFAYGGADLMKKTVENYLQEPILYHVIVDYNSFPEFVDMLGGVEVDVQKKMRYVDRAGKLDINISPGLQVLNGKKALHFVRFRKDALGDIGRVQRQQQFIKSMIKKAYNPAIIVKIPELAEQTMKIFKTDMSSTLAVQLAGFVQNEVGRDKMYFSMLPGEAALIDRLSYWVGDVDAAKAFLSAPLASLISGDVTEGKGKNAKKVDFSDATDELGKNSSVKRAKDEKPEAVGKDTHGVMSKDEIASFVKSIPEAVAVLNGVGKSGVSSEISTRLQKLGVDVTHSGNAKHFDYRYSNVVYPTGASESVKETAKKLGKMLGIPKNLVRQSNQAFYASVIAGHDYKEIVKLLDGMLKEMDKGEM